LIGIVEEVTGALFISGNQKTGGQHLGKACTLTQKRTSVNQASYRYGVMEIINRMNTA
jgi:hypothetical protein